MTIEGLQKSVRDGIMLRAAGYSGERRADLLHCGELLVEICMLEAAGELTDASDLKIGLKAVMMNWEVTEEIEAATELREILREVGIGVFKVMVAAATTVLA